MAPCEGAGFVVVGAGEDRRGEVGEGADGEEIAGWVEECEVSVFKPGDGEAVGAVVGEFGFEVGGHDLIITSCGAKRSKPSTVCIVKQVP